MREAGGGGGGMGIGKGRLKNFQQSPQLLPAIPLQLLHPTDSWGHYSLVGRAAKKGTGSWTAM